MLITARDRHWLDAAVAAATGNASSTILCDCEAGLDRYVGPGGDRLVRHARRPAGRRGAVSCAAVSQRSRAALERSLLVRLSQNVLTCPTASCFNLLDTPEFFKLGRKIAFFGDGHQFRDERHGRPVWVVPILSGEFIIDRRFGYRDGLMGGNLWFMGATADAALEAADEPRPRPSTTPGVILPFPGGVAGSGSKAGSRYSFTIASTYAEYCPDACATSWAGRRACRRASRRSRKSSSTAAIWRRSPPPRRPPSPRRRTRQGLSRSRPATTAAGWARALSTCARRSSRAADFARREHLGGHQAEL